MQEHQPQEDQHLIQKKTGLLEWTSRNQSINPSNISPIRRFTSKGLFSSSPSRPVVISNPPQTNWLSETLRSGRPSGMQHHDGISTRSIRAEIGEPHAQLQTPVRGRPSWDHNHNHIYGGLNYDVYGRAVPNSMIDQIKQLKDWGCPR